MRLTLHERDRCYRLIFAFRRDKVSDECYSLALPKAESPAELAVILQHEADILGMHIMKHVSERCEGEAVDGISYPASDPVWDDD